MKSTVSQFLKIQLFLIMACVAGACAMQHLDGVVAVVGDSAILSSELQAYTYMKVSQAGQNPDSIDDLTMNILNNQGLEELIDGKVLLVHAEKDTNISITDYEVETELNNRIAMILKQNKLTIDQFEEILKNQQGIGLTKFKMEIRKQIRNELIKQRVQQLYVNAGSLTKKEVTAFYQQYRDSLPVNGKSVLLSTILLQIKPSDQIRQEAFAKINAIKERLAKGEDFAALAKQYSQDPNAANGGDLGFISKGTLSEIAFEEKAFSLKVGQNSEPFETRLGFHIISVVDKKEQMVHVRQIFIPVKAPEADIAKIQAQLDSIRTHVKTREDFVRAVRQYSQDDVTKSREGQLKWQAVSSLDPQIAKAIDSLAVGGVSAPLRRDNTFAIYRIDERKDSRSLTLENDWNDIADIAQRISTQKKLVDIVKKWRQETYIDIRL
jgi:peptidyl-prolyl cis-trans isomerase SurA